MAGGPSQAPALPQAAVAALAEAWRGFVRWLVICLVLAAAAAYILTQGN